MHLKTLNDVGPDQKSLSPVDELFGVFDPQTFLPIHQEAKASAISGGSPESQEQGAQETSALERLEGILRAQNLQDLHLNLPEKNISSGTTSLASSSISSGTGRSIASASPSTSGGASSPSDAFTEDWKNLAENIPQALTKR